MSIADTLSDFHGNATEEFLITRKDEFKRLPRDLRLAVLDMLDKVNETREAIDKYQVGA